MLSPRSLVLSLALLALTADAKCSSYSARYGKEIDGVCVCTSASCDEVSNEYLSLPGDKVGLFQTSFKAGDRLAYSTLPLDGANGTTAAGTIEITLDTAVKYQTIKGFGGAFTDAAAVNHYRLKPDLQEKFIQAYWGKNGLQYSLGRVPIGGTDYSETIYAYNPVEGDLEMKNFSVDMDKAKKIPFIKRALSAAVRKVDLVASSWAPPTWMTREKVVQNCHLIGEPGEPYWKALALYYSRFLDEYKKEGVTFWAMTPQNEPNEQFGFLYWNQHRFNNTQQRDFIKKDLGPILRKNHPEVILIMMDDQKDLLPEWPQATMNDPEARQYVSGVAVHWYKNVGFIDDDLGNFQNLAAFHKLYPDVFIIATEASEGSLPEIVGTGKGVRLLEPAITWRRAENYARDIINDLANFAVGWIDWNLALDTKSMPNWVGNDVDAPIIVDEISGAEFYKQPMYYVLGHLSKFVPPGSVRISLAVSDEKKFVKVDRVAFLTPSGQVVAVFSNRETFALQLKLRDAASGRAVALTLPGNAVQTVLFAEPKASTPVPTTPTPTTPTPTTTTVPAPTPTTTAPTPTNPTPTTPTPTATVPNTTTPKPSTPCPLPSPPEPITTTPAPTTKRPAC